MRQTLCGCAIVVVVGCGGEDSSGVPEAQVTDSAGVTIVTSPPADVVYARLVDEPALSLGTLEGADELMFGRIASVVRDMGGDLIVADNGAGEIRVFDAGGSHLRTFGRKGEGPGEFQVLSGAWPGAEGTVVALDRRLSRITQFDSGGSLIATAEIAGGGGATNMRGLAGPEVVLSQVTDFGITPSFDASDLQDLADAVEGDGSLVLFFRHRLDGELVDTLAQRQGQKMSMSTSGSGGQMSLQLLVVPFSRQPTAVGSPQGVAVAGGSDYEVALYNRTGTLHQIVRLGVAPPLRTDEHLDAYVRNSGSPFSDEASIQARIDMYRDMSMPDRLPGYDELLFADTGELWARRYRQRGADMAHWDVFGTGGHHLGRVEIPTSFRPEEVSGGQLVGVSTDDLGVERVEIRDLILGGG